MRDPPASPRRSAGSTVLRLVAGRARDAGRPDALAPIVQAAGTGDSDAVRTLLVTVAPHLLRVVRKVLGQAHPDVDDVVQESAFAVVDALPRYRGECSALHFVCRVAVLTAMNARRREAAHKRAAERDEGVGVDDLAARVAQPDAAVSAREAAEVVRGLLDRLPEEQAETLALHSVLGYTASEIAALDGAPIETVRSRLRLAKAALRARIMGDPRLATLAGGWP